jgi:hypothetical protein
MKRKLNNIYPNSYSFYFSLEETLNEDIAYCIQICVQTKNTYKTKNTSKTKKHALRINIE